MTRTAKHHDGISGERWRGARQREIVIGGPRNMPFGRAVPPNIQLPPAGVAMTALHPADAVASVAAHSPATASVVVARARTASRLTVAIVCVALFATGCGSRQSTTPFNATNVMRSALKFVDCMRSHGVPNMPDPQVFHSGGKTGIVIPDPGSASTSPQFKSAQRACNALQSLGAVSNTSQTASARAQRQRQALAFAVCMRSHGDPRFPDPSSKGVFTSKLDASVPQVQAANKACQRILPTGADPLAGGSVPAP